MSFLGHCPIGALDFLDRVTVCWTSTTFRMATLFADTAGTVVLRRSHAGIGGRPQRRQRTHLCAFAPSSPRPVRWVTRSMRRMLRISSVFEPPGCAAVAIVGAPLDLQPARQFVGEHQVGQLGPGVCGDPVVLASPRAGRRSRSWPRIRCAELLTVTTREPSTGSRLSSSRPVSAKWPRWLVPNCSSKPSLVLGSRWCTSRRRC